MSKDCDHYIGGMCRLNHVCGLLVCSKKENSNVRYNALADVTAAEVEIIVDALYHYQLLFINYEKMEAMEKAVKSLIDKITKDLPEID